MLAGCVSAERDAEGSEPACDVAFAGSEFGCDVGQGPASGHVLLVEPVAIHGERRAEFGGGSPADSVLSGESGDDAPVDSVHEADLP